MPSFSNRSLDKLNTCHPDLQRLFRNVIQYYDCTILEGLRTDERQYELFRQGKSKLDGEHKRSKHQSVIPDDERLSPSLISRAVDVAPYPIDWNDTKRFYHFGGLVKGIALQLDIPIRWGGDWDGDNDLNDQTFFDLPHFELI